MADIRSKILSKYNIDIAQENIFKLYKIDSADISIKELEIKFQDMRGKWKSSVNGANEKIAERDRIRLEKADKYEEILSNDKLRKEVFNFYKKSSASGNNATPDGGSIEFARGYFELVSTTKKIKKADVDFFFKYYQSERKNKKAILEMLSKEMKIGGLGNDEKSEDEDTEESEGKKKKDSSPVIVNLFQEDTILKIKRAVEKFEEAAKSNELFQKYPKLNDGLFLFLEIENIEDAKQFVETMNTKGKEVYAVRQERGTEYVPLVDLFNILKDIGDNQDVVDNFSEFKLLLKYPNLTSYMFSFVDMKPETIKEISNIAKEDYYFRDDNDFILNYYVQVHDNFGISDSRISSILRKAEKKARQNKVLKKTSKFFGRENKKRIPFGAKIIYWLLYWPIFAVYLFFEVTKFVLTQLHRFTIPVFTILFVLENWILHKFGADNILVLRKIIYKDQWVSWLNNFIKVGTNGIEIFLLSLLAIFILLSVYVIPPLFVSRFFAKFSDDLNKRFDWMGNERTFKQIFAILRKKTEDQYTVSKKLFYKNKIPKILINWLCIASIIAIIIFMPTGLRICSEKTGYFQAKSNEEEISGSEENTGDTGLSNKPVGKTVVITADIANIRSGPGKDKEVIITANQKATFVATGKQETLSDGEIWYELYIDADMNETGWASQKVIDFQ